MLPGWDPRELIEAPARQAAALAETGHRPWPLPGRAWVQGQTWETLLFAHWRVDEAALRPKLPAGLELDAFDGSAWLGITPFRVTGLRLRGLPPLPFVSTFLELNVRTCVSVEDKPGIWFFSLDAESQLAVEAARRAYRLPYHRARMSAAPSGGWLDYESSRADGSGKAFRGRYRSLGDVFNAEPGSLEWFLAERYCLYAEGDDGRLQRAEIHHGPWPLQRAEATIELNTMPPERVELEGEPLLHFAQRQDTVIWPLEPLGGS